MHSGPALNSEKEINILILKLLGDIVDNMRQVCNINWLRVGESCLKSVENSFNSPTVWVVFEILISF